MYFWDFPGGPVARALHSQCRGPRVQCLVRAVDPTCCNEDQRSRVPQLRLGAAKEINIFYKKNIFHCVKILKIIKLLSWYSTSWCLLSISVISYFCLLLPFLKVAKLNFSQLDFTLEYLTDIQVCKDEALSKLNAEDYKEDFLVMTEKSTMSNHFCQKFCTLCIKRCKMRNPAVANVRKNGCGIT